MQVRSLPVWLGAGVMAACTVLLVVNLAVLAIGHSAIKLVPGLTGVTAPEPVPQTPDAILHGQFQATITRELGGDMPLYPTAVRLRNQLEYSLFGFSPNPVVMVGQDHALIERAYADEYCSRDIARWRPGALVWAARIRQMQDEEATRGKAFLYVLTPSKVAQYPDLLPPAFNCPSHQADRVGLVPDWIAMLQADGVHLVDTTAVLQAAKRSYPMPLFPAGGTHWNAVGEAVAQQAVLTALDRLVPGRGFAASPFTWRMLPHPVRDSDDVDLARLLNLFIPAANGPVPAVTPHPVVTPAACQPSRVVIVGGSFSHATLKALSGMPCSVKATEYEYWHTYTLRWGNGELDKHFGVDEVQRDAEVLGADVLIYEENEQLLSQPLHGQALSAFLQAQGTPTAIP